MAMQVFESLAVVEAVGSSSFRVSDCWGLLLLLRVATLVLARRISWSSFVLVQAVLEIRSSSPWNIISASHHLLVTK
jgi:hypothetical protein